MTEPMLCCRAAGGYCDRCDLLVGLDGLHVIGVERDDGGRLSGDGGVRADADGLPDLRGRRARPRPGRGAVWSMRRRWAARCGSVWRKRRWVCPDAGLPGRDVRGAGRAGRRAAGVADDAGVPVGDRADPPRARLVNGVRRQLGHRVAHGVGLDQAAAGQAADAD